MLRAVTALNICTVRGWLPSYTEGSVTSAKKRRSDFYRDIKALHSCGSDQIFEEGIQLFKQKWMVSHPLLFKQFAKTWLHADATWYLGARSVPGWVPRHSCAVENVNSSMKEGGPKKLF